MGTPASRKTLRLPDFEPRLESWGSTPFKGTPSRTASLRSSGVELNTVMKAREVSGMPYRIRWISRGRSRIFSVSDRGDASCAHKSVSRARAWLAGIPASSSK